MDRRPRIGIDGYNLAIPHGTGVATYGYTLGRTLAGLGYSLDGVFGVDTGRDPRLVETLFYDRLAHPVRDRGRLRRMIRSARGLRPLGAVAVPQSARVDRTAFTDRLPPFDRLWSSPNLFERAHRLFFGTGRVTTVTVPDPPEIMHWTYPVPIRLAGARNIYTIHDLVPLTLPGATLDDKTRYHATVRGCVERGDHICTVSEASRAEIIGMLGADPARVTCTWQVSPMRFGAVDATGGARQFGLDEGGYFLFFGAIEPKKNLGRLLEAYLSLDTSTPLVIVSGRSWRTEDALYLLPREDRAEDPRHKALEGRIIRMDYLPRRLLATLIASARAVLFPSLAEGFGLPMHEAMLLGTPVLSSTVAALREVAGDGALLVDPQDIAAMRDGIMKLDRDETYRVRLGEAGRRSAERFSVEAYGRALTALYDAVLAVEPR